MPRLVVLATLCVLVLAACGTPVPNPPALVSVAPSSSASASATVSGSPIACAGADISAAGGPWGGAAGSRGSDILVENQGSAACVLPAGPTIAMVDQAGTVLLANTPPPAGAGPTIEPAGTVGFSLVIGNWCDQTVSLPLHFSLAMAAGAVDIANLTVRTIDDLPPCNGPGQLPSLSATSW